MKELISEYLANKEDNTTKFGLKETFPENVLVEETQAISCPKETYARRARAQRAARVAKRARKKKIQTLRERERREGIAKRRQLRPAAKGEGALLRGRGRGGASSRGRGGFVQVRTFSMALLDS